MKSNQLIKVLLKTIWILQYMIPVKRCLKNKLNKISNDQIMLIILVRHKYSRTVSLWINKTKYCGWRVSASF